MAPAMREGPANFTLLKSTAIRAKVKLLWFREKTGLHSSSSAWRFAELREGGPIVDRS